MIYTISYTLSPHERENNRHCCHNKSLTGSFVFAGEGLQVRINLLIKDPKLMNKILCINRCIWWGCGISMYMIWLNNSKGI